MGKQGTATPRTRTADARWLYVRAQLDELEMAAADVRDGRRADWIGLSHAGRDAELTEWLGFIAWAESVGYAWPSYLLHLSTGRVRIVERSGFGFEQMGGWHRAECVDCGGHVVSWDGYEQPEYARLAIAEHGARGCAA